MCATDNNHDSSHVAGISHQPGKQHTETNGIHLHRIAISRVTPSQKTPQSTVDPSSFGKSLKGVANLSKRRMHRKGGACRHSKRYKTELQLTTREAATTYPDEAEGESGGDVGCKRIRYLCRNPTAWRRSVDPQRYPGIGLSSLSVPARHTMRCQVCSVVKAALIRHAAFPVVDKRTR